MEEKYIASVDLGSSKIGLMIAQIIGDNIKIIYYKTMPSSGIKSSAIFNPKKAEEPIKALIANAEDELKVKILQVVVSLPRCDIRQEVATAQASRSNKDESITEEEVENLKYMAQNDYPLADNQTEKLYAAIAQSFSSDESFQLIEDDIIGVVSEKLEGNFKLLIGKKTPVHNIEKIFTNMNINPTRLYFTADTTSNAILTEDEKDNGVALIDFGGGATSVSIYINKVLRYYSSIPFGGKSITDDIKLVCSISEELAENIKLAYGVCLPDRLQNLTEKIIQIEYQDIGEYKQIPVKYMSEIITARTNEIIEAILYKIWESGLHKKLRNGLVITGGGAKLANLAVLLKETSGYNVRLGNPRHLISVADNVDVYNTVSTNCIGMILAAKHENINCLSEFTKVDNTIEVETINITEEDANTTTTNISPEVIQPEMQTNEVCDTSTNNTAQEPIIEEINITPQGAETIKVTEDQPITEHTTTNNIEAEQQIKEPKKRGFLGKLLWKVSNTVGNTLDNMYENTNND